MFGSSSPSSQAPSLHKYNFGTDFAYKAYRLQNDSIGSTFVVVILYNGSYGAFKVSWCFGGQKRDTMAHDGRPAADMQQSAVDMQQSAAGRRQQNGSLAASLENDFKFRFWGSR